MAVNIFEQFGMKEVADVQFEALEADSYLGVAVGDIVLYLDTLKVSTIETTAEQTEAKGGKGAPPLIIWDFGKEITVTLQDALFTAASLATICGAAITEATTTDTVRITKELVVGTDHALALPYPAIAGQKIRYNLVTPTDMANARGQITAVAGVSQTIAAVADGTAIRVFYDTLAAAEGSTTSSATENVTGHVSEGRAYFYLSQSPKATEVITVNGDQVPAVNWAEINGTIVIDATGFALINPTFVDGATITVTYTYTTNARDALIISIDAQHFPGTYKIVGDTLVRNRNGKDYPYQFVIPRAKVGSEVSFTMESEGDPAVFDMSLRVLRADNGQMIQFKKYNLD